MAKSPASRNPPYGFVTVATDAFSGWKSGARLASLHPMQCVFVQIRCRPGTTYLVADAIAFREIHSELYSTSGEYDLLAKVYVPEGEDVGHFINENLATVENIERTLTTMTFKAF